MLPEVFSLIGRVPDQVGSNMRAASREYYVFAVLSSCAVLAAGGSLWADVKRPGNPAPCE